MKNRKEYLLELISLAKGDLEDANILYTNNSYRNAIYLLQQSVEKTMKSWALLVYNKVEPEEFTKKISHFSPRAFYMLIEEGLPTLIEGIAEFCQGIGIPNIESLFSEEIEKLKEEQIVEKNYLKAIINKDERKKKIFFIKMGEELLQSLNDPQVIESTLDLARSIQIYGDIFCTILEMVVSLIIPILPPDIKNIVELFSFEISRYSRDFTQKFAPVLILSLITYPYEACTRYPNEKIEIEQFNQDLPIIQSFRTLLNLANNGLEWLEENAYF
ncbi:MAG: HEPN domain-containing protein [Candidatus Heimdallarchaeaceae archaeon]